MNRFYHVVHIGVHIPEWVKHPAQCLRLQSQQSDCNLSNLTAISAIRLQSQQSDCNSHNQTAIFTINEQILPCRTYRGPHSRVCQAPIALFKTAISAIRLQSQQSDCNLSNQTAISTITLQSSQSMNRFYPVVHIGVHIPECVKHQSHCLRLQFQQSDCNLSNQTAISAIRLQSPQSDCNLHNQWTDFTLSYI